MNGYDYSENDAYVKDLVCRYTGDLDDSKKMLVFDEPRNLPLLGSCKEVSWGDAERVLGYLGLGFMNSRCFPFFQEVVESCYDGGMKEMMYYNGTLAATEKMYASDAAFSLIYDLNRDVDLDWWELPKNEEDRKNPRIMIVTLGLFFGESCLLDWFRSWTSVDKRWSEDAFIRLTAISEIYDQEMAELLGMDVESASPVRGRRRIARKMNYDEDHYLNYYDKPRYFPSIGMRTALFDSEVKAVLQYLGLDFRSSRFYQYIVENFAPKVRGGITRFEKSDYFHQIERQYNSEAFRCLRFDWKNDEDIERYYFDSVFDRRQGPCSVGEIAVQIEAYWDVDYSFYLECLFEDCADDCLCPGELIDDREAVRIYNEDFMKIAMMDMQTMDAARSE